MLQYTDLNKDSSHNRQSLCSTWSMEFFQTACEVSLKTTMYVHCQIINQNIIPLSNVNSSQFGYAFTKDIDLLR